MDKTQMSTEPNTVVEWANFQFWLWMLIYLSISFLYRIVTDRDAPEDSDFIRDSEDFWAWVNMLIHILLFPGKIFWLAIWPLLFKLKIVKGKNPFD